MTSKGKSRPGKADGPVGADEPHGKGEDHRAEDANDGKSAAAVEGLWHLTVRSLPTHPKQPISFRVDQDVLQFFKQDGPRYQTRMNEVLRAFMTAYKEGDK